MKPTLYFWSIHRGLSVPPSGPSSITEPDPPCTTYNMKKF